MRLRATHTSLMSSPPDPPRSALPRGWGLLVGCCAVAVVMGVAQGQDANWDLLNYHYYDPYALLHGRLDLDTLPAQMQTFHCPFGDLVGHLLLRAGLDSRVTTAVLSLPAGVGLFLLALLARRLAPGNVWAMAAVALGATGAIGLPEAGTSMSEWHTASLVLLAIWLILGPGAQGERRLLVLGAAGLCGGAAVGLKLTTAPFAVGLAAMTLGLPGAWRSRLARLVSLGAGGVLAFAAVYGPWGWVLLQRYGNPFFPYFNNVFRSPWLPPLGFRDELSVLRGLEPLRFLVRLGLWGAGRTPTDEVARDPRMLLAVPAIAWLALRPRHPGRAAWRAMGVFCVISYLSWARGAGILRYALPLELVSGLAIALAAATLGHLRGGVLVLSALVALLAVTPARLELGRAPHGRPAVAVELPALPVGAMVVVATADPVAFVVPSLPPEIPVVSLVNNLTHPGPEMESRLYRAAAARITGHPGPLIVLTKGGLAGKEHGGVPILDLLARLELAPDEARCSPVQSQVSPGLRLCPLERHARR